jgi:cytoskeletal protein CcmA (bactofilin family)
MRSLVADQRLETSDETARLPALPSSFLPESLAHEAADAHEDPKIAVLGPTLCFKGELSAQEDFILQGRVEGSIRQAQRIVIATGGVVVGNIHALVAVVDGTVEGDLHGLESVTVNKTGRVAGNIFAPRVSLVDGAVFNGRIDMRGTPVVDQVPTQHAPIPQVPTQKVSLVLPPPPVRESAARRSIG